MVGSGGRLGAENKTNSAQLKLEFRLSLAIGSKKVFELDPNYKYSPAGPKKGQKCPKWGKTEIKAMGIYFQNQS